MSRSAGRLEVEGTLLATTGLRVGAARGRGDVDLPLLRDGRGRPLVPATSLIGSLRRWAVDNGVADAAVDVVFGGHEGSLGASRLSVRDMPIESDHDGVAGSPLPSLRTGVGIDRATGAAAPGVLYALEVIPAGARLRFSAELELPIASDDRRAATELLGALLGALERGEIAVGAMSARGLGGIRLEADSLSVRECSYASRSSTLAALAGGTAVDRASLGSKPPRGSIVLAEVHWRPVGALMSKGSTDGLAVDALPLVESSDGRSLAPVLPGSSIKGVMRSFCERWWRTALGRGVGPAMGPDQVLQQIVVGELIDSMFGAISDSDSTAGTADRSGSRRGALAVDDCRATATISPDMWDQLFDDDQAAVVKAIDDSGLRGVLSPAMHVGIDRWTGGAADHLLFSVLEVRDAGWQPLRLRLDLAQVSRGLDGAAADRRQCAAVAMLLVMIRSLSEGLIRLGYATQRGSGGVSVERVALSSSTINPTIAAINGEYADLGTELADATARPLMEALASELDAERGRVTAGGEGR